MSSGPVTACLVWGELLWDRFPDGDRLGGAPANVAWHLAQLGTPVALVTRVGDDVPGHAAIARLATIGVDTSLIQIDGERPTGEVTVTLEAGASGGLEPRYRLVPGCAWERIELVPAVIERLRGTRALVFGTLSQRTPEGLASFSAALAAASPRVLRVCDPNLRPSSGAPGDEVARRHRSVETGEDAGFDLSQRRTPHSVRLGAAGDDDALEQAMGAADVVKLGERERQLVQERIGARLVHSAPPPGTAEPVSWLLARGARLVAVTRGADGSTWHAPGVPPIEVAAVPARPGGDNVGCGDAYVAGLVHGLLAGWPWSRIGRVAAAVAAEVAGARGATPILDGAALIAGAEAP